eukprot:gb/GEZN01022143.1/.p1 GENE.gb/GEZN01022143.1/~~gb/GEZN01022143.1/.p1  ORF type:complete len:123 (-),score=11.85 gb/GEZN01022143.1/:187-555(-)
MERVNPFFGFHVLYAFMILSLAVVTYQPRKKWPAIVCFIILLFWWLNDPVKVLCLSFCVMISMAWRIHAGEFEKRTLPMIIVFLSAFLGAFRIVEIVAPAAKSSIAAAVENLQSNTITEREL